MPGEKDRILGGWQGGRGGPLDGPPGEWCPGHSLGDLAGVLANALIRPPAPIVSPLPHSGVQQPDEPLLLRKAFYQDFA